MFRTLESEDQVMRTVKPSHLASLRTDVENSTKLTQYNAAWISALFIRRLQSSFFSKVSKQLDKRLALVPFPAC
jgi:hypothetical protein